MPERADVVCIGAGIIGLATARSLSRRFSDLDIRVVEAEPRPAVHQTGHNSGVIHSGLYYKPGSLKARNCVGGRKRLIEYCDRHGIPYEICGKLVIATDPEEIPRLDELERRGRANGLVGLERLPSERIAEFEPHATGVDALWVPETGIVDYKAVARAYANELEEGGVPLHLRTRVTGIVPRSDGVVVETTAGDFEAGHAINCAGLQSDRVARMAGLDPDVRIVPFRGEYFDIAPERRDLLRGLIYPVPDPRFPFLGVHLTRRVDGSVEAGPNAVLALKREGYDRGSFDARDTWSSLSYPGFWKMALRFWKVGISEMARSGSRSRFARDLRRFVPDLSDADLMPGGSGIRAQALDRKGNLVDDFAIETSPRMLHVLNAPSPGATASLAIGDTLADRAAEMFGLGARS